MYLSTPTFRIASSVRSKGLPLTDDEIRKAAPSVFAEQPHNSRSARYAYIPTVEVLAGLRKEGFEVFDAMQARCRSEGRREHTKHLLRLRHAGDIGRKLNLGDRVAEICMLNSHDGTSSYQMFSGVFRLACSNGLMVPESTLAGIKVAHTGQVKDNVIEGAFEILDGCTRVIEDTQKMASILLSSEEQAAFATAALTLRYDEGKSPIKADQLLRARRSDDRKDDLWTTFNRVQENVVRGRLSGRTATGGRTSTRAIKGIDQSVALNKALWTLADEMAKLKTSH